MRTHAGNEDGTMLVDSRYLVVRRPVVVRAHRLDRKQRQDDHKRGDLPAPSDQWQQEHAGSRAPSDWRQLEEREKREDDDAADRAEDVEPVCVEWFEAEERAR